jgi:hypothetical protein
MLPVSRAIKRNVSLRLDTFAFPVTIHSSVAEDTDAQLKTVCHGQEGMDRVTNLATGAGKTVSAAALKKAKHALSTVNSHLICPVCDAHSGFGKGRPVDGGIVGLSAEVLAAADAADAKFISTMTLQPYLAAEVHAELVPSGKTYYLSVSANKDLYALIVALVKKRTDIAYVTQWAVRTAASPFQLVVEPGDVLALRQLADPALVRARPQMSGGVVNETYMRAAEELSDLLIEPFDVTKFERPRTRIIAEFVAGQTPTVVPVDGSAVEGAQVLSLLDALEAAKARQAPAKKPAKKSTRRATANA